ncbi:MAG: hypothetical protein DMG52_33925, partial [Acidobacteria bacterium]
VFNAETYLAFLQNLARRYRRQGAILIHDNASYHTKPLVQSWLDVNRDWLEVKSWPKYSPELNPTERIWQYTRKNGTHNRYFENERLPPADSPVNTPFFVTIMSLYLCAPV